MMSIVVSCACGKKFSARSELAGRTVKCLSCGKALTVPNGQPNGKSLADKIVATCKCGKSFGADPNLAGRRVRCPKCAEVMTVPEAPRPAAQVSNVSEPAAASTQYDNRGLLELLDELGLEASRTGHRCDSCKADMALDAVLCLKCGYHAEMGKHLKRA